jgi:integrase
MEHLRSLWRRCISYGSWSSSSSEGELRRADIETFGFYKDAVEEELLEHSPAAHVRRPRLDYESHATALDRNEPGALLVAAGLGPATDHALISLLALNGLRVSEATGADIEHFGLERGHRTVAGQLPDMASAPSEDWLWALSHAHTCPGRPAV